MVKYANNLAMETGFLTIIEISSYLNIKTKTLYAIIESGEIPHYRIGRLIRFKKDEIDKWMKRNRAGKEKSDVSTSSLKKVGRPKRSPARDIDRLIKKAIDVETDKYYSPDHGKSDRIEGLRKEVNNGSI